MDRARRHGVVVPIYYEARLAKLHLTNEFIDEDFEEISESVAVDPEIKESLKRRFARLEKLILSEERLEKRRTKRIMSSESNIPRRDGFDGCRIWTRLGR